MTRLAYWRAVYRQARAVHAAAQRGEVVITVPHRLAGDVQAYAWRRKMELGAEKWARRAAAIPTPDWQAAARQDTERREP